MKPRQFWERHPFITSVVGSLVATALLSLVRPVREAALEVWQALFQVVELRFGLLVVACFAPMLGVGVYRALRRPRAPAVNPPAPPSPSLSDRRLLRDFIFDLPSDGALGRFASRTAANPYRDRESTLLDDFLRKWSGAERDFLNAEVQAAKERFLDSLDAFVTLLSLETFVVGNDMHGVPPEWIDSQPERYTATIRKIDKAARNTHSVHQEFLRFARATLER